jgi:hypothetical protein
VPVLETASPETTPSEQNDWARPQAMAIPKQGYFQFERGRYGPVYPKIPVSYGFSIIGKVKPGREQAVRATADEIKKTLKLKKSFSGMLDQTR